MSYKVMVMHSDHEDTLAKLFDKLDKLAAKGVVENLREMKEAAGPIVICWDHVDVKLALAKLNKFIQFYKANKVYVCDLVEFEKKLKEDDNTDDFLNAVEGTLIEQQEIIEAYKRKRILKELRSLKHKQKDSSPLDESVQDEKKQCRESDTTLTDSTISRSTCSHDAPAPREHCDESRNEPALNAKEDNVLNETPSFTCSGVCREDVKVDISSTELRSVIYAETQSMELLEQDVKPIATSTTGIQTESSDIRNPCTMADVACQSEISEDESSKEVTNCISDTEFQVALVQQQHFSATEVGGGRENNVSSRVNNFWKRRTQHIEDNNLTLQTVQPALAALLTQLATRLGIPVIDTSQYDNTEAGIIKGDGKIPESFKYGVACVDAADLHCIFKSILYFPAEETCPYISKTLAREIISFFVQCGLKTIALTNENMGCLAARNLEKNETVATYVSENKTGFTVLKLRIFARIKGIILNLKEKTTGFYGVQYGVHCQRNGANHFCPCERVLDANPEAVRISFVNNKKGLSNIPIVYECSGSLVKPSLIRHLYYDRMPQKSANMLADVTCLSEESPLRDSHIAALDYGRWALCRVCFDFRKLNALAMPHSLGVINDNYSGIFCAVQGCKSGCTQFVLLENDFITPEKDTKQ